MVPQSEERTFAYGGWTVVVRVTLARPGECVAGHADLHRAGEHKCRLVLASGGQGDLDEVVSGLEVRARAFVDGWDGDGR